mgnify:CR=1 FL=1
MEQGIFTGRDNFVAALRHGLVLAEQQGARELCWLDADFVQWPLSEPIVLDLLTAWEPASMSARKAARDTTTRASPMAPQPSAQRRGDGERAGLRCRGDDGVGWDVDALAGAELGAVQQRVPAVQHQRQIGAALRQLGVAALLTHHDDHGVRRHTVIALDDAGEAAAQQRRVAARSFSH